MSRSVVLHIGIAKTGTTFLQRRLFANREQLELHGTRYPGAGPAAHFHAALDLRGTTFKGHVYPEVEGAWGRLVEAADGFDGRTLVSHETLARATPAQIEQAVSGFATDDVRVVVTVRDVVRQLPAVWQETLKNRGETPYDEYVQRVFARWRPGGRAKGGYWAAQDVEAVVRRWARVVGEQRVTVVTVPRPGADRDELWRRFAEATGLPDIAYAEPQDTGNTSLGMAEAELLRRLNPLLTDTLDWPTYDARIKRRLAEQILAPLATQGRLVLPPQWMPQSEQVAAAQIEFLHGTEVVVVGDLEDLRPRSDEEAGSSILRQPADLTDSELLDTALRGLAGLAAVPKTAPAPPARRPLRVRGPASVKRRLSPWLRRLRRRPSPPKP